MDKSSLLELLSQVQRGTVTPETATERFRSLPFAETGYEDIGRDDSAAADALPNSRFELFEESAHWPQYEDAKTFNRLHVEFLLGR